MKIQPDILAKATERFELELSQTRPLGGMEGVALAYEREGKSLVLKIIPGNKNQHNQVEEIKAKSRFTLFLADHGVRVARPVLSPDGNLVERIRVMGNDYYLTTATRAEGRHIDLYDPSQSSEKLFKAWGEVTGKMHNLARLYPSWRKTPFDGENPSPIIDWKEEHQHFEKWCSSDDIREKWIHLSQTIDRLPINRDCFGLIHNDIHPRNFLVDQEGRITIIDFDVCAYHFFIKDIAIALFFANWIGNPGKGRSKDDYLTQFLQNFLEGYSTENDLDPFWYQQLPIFLKHHQILLFIVFTDEWKSPNKWQQNTLQTWKSQIIKDQPVLQVLI